MKRAIGTYWVRDGSGAVILAEWDGERWWPLQPEANLPEDACTEVARVDEPGDTAPARCTCTHAPEQHRTRRQGTFPDGTTCTVTSCECFAWAENVGR